MSHDRNMMNKTLANMARRTERESRQASARREDRQQQVRAQARGRRGF